MDNSYTIKNISVVQYTPKIKRLNKIDRDMSALIYIINGRYHYKTAVGEFYAENGDVIYLPKHATYSYAITSDKTESIQAEFDTDTTVSKHPVCMQANSEATLLFRNMLSNFYADKFAVISDIYHMLSLFLKNGREAPDTFGKISPAVEYINQNITKRIYAPALAAMCGISESHFRRLFSEKLGMSPIKYKNTILIKSACDMLRANSLNVSEIAEALDFNDIYTFSQAFKKETGVSPKKYQSMMNVK